MYPDQGTKCQVPQQRQNITALEKKLYNAKISILQCVLFRRSTVNYKGKPSSFAFQTFGGRTRIQAVN